MPSQSDDYFSLGLKFWTLGIEASSVIWLRSMRIAAGGALGRREGRIMIEEKVQANIALTVDLMTHAIGATPQSIASRSMDHYTSRVRANRKRLSR